MSLIDKAEHYRAELLIVNVPEWFKDPEFLKVLNDPSKCLMTWHYRGEEATEFSDVILMVDPSLSGEGAEDGIIPDKYWDQIVEMCRAKMSPSSEGHHIMVKLTNMAE